jgi:tRNA(Ile)-lysidine synthase
MAIVSILQNSLQRRHDGGITWIAYSGGLDSSVLLHILMQLRQEKHFALKAVHIHHGLHPKANEWQHHCEVVCREGNIELCVHTIDLSDSHENIEARARECRYAYFSSLLEKEDVLCTAHHQDDQAETFLLQLMRGAGPKGLSAMPVETILGEGKLIRPLLNMSRDELLVYAQQNNISWVEDDSNKNTRFSRNFMRQEVLPLLKSRWPSVAATISRSAKHCAETQELLEAFIAPLFHECLLENKALSLIALKKLTPIQQKHIFRHWLFYGGFSSPNELKLQNCLRVFLTARRDRHPMVTWGNVVVRRYRDELRAERVPAPT